MTAISSDLRQDPELPRTRLSVWAMVATASFACYILAHAVQSPASAIISAIGVGACGWAWLVARALFDASARDARWAPMVAGAVAVTGAAFVLSPGANLIGRVAGNAYAISGSAALMLTFVEPFLRWSPDLPPAEKRFRIVFTGTYAILVTFSVMGLWSESVASDALLRDRLVKITCAAVGLIGMGLAVRFRRRHLLTSAPAPRRTATMEDHALAERIMWILQTEDLAARTALKIADVAAMLNQPEYRVSRAIKTALGSANFNRWINTHRVARATTMLADADERRSILQIAFACGFASLGPFNRAFREETGMTPTQYRAACQSR